MREEIRNVGRLDHMLQAINVLLVYRDKYPEKTIQDDPIIFFGFVKHLEIIGEAAYKLTLDYKEKHTEITWRTVEGLRHVLVHGYYKIDKTTIMRILKEDIEPLKPIIQKLFDEELEKHKDEV